MCWQILIKINFNTVFRIKYMHGTQCVILFAITQLVELIFLYMNCMEKISGWFVFDY